MKKKVIIRAKALKSLDEACSWYDEKQAGLGIKFYKSFEVTRKQISQFPESYQLSKKNYRLGIIDGFPYVIVYVNDNGAVIIYNIISAHQSPEKRYPKNK